MAITDVAQYAHLRKTDMEALGAELDTIRRDVEENRGAQDATYIRRTIAFQRTLEARNTFHHLGMGHGRLVVAMALFPQLPPPRVHQRPGHG